MRTGGMSDGDGKRFVHGATIPQERSAPQFIFTIKTIAAGDRLCPGRKDGPDPTARPFSCLRSLC